MKAGCSEDLKNALFAALLCGQVFKLWLLSYCLHSRANYFLTPVFRHSGFAIRIRVGSDPVVSVRSIVASDGSDVITDATRGSSDAVRSPLISAPSSRSQNRLGEEQRLAAETAARCKKVEFGCELGQKAQEDSARVLGSLASVSANFNPELLISAPSSTRSSPRRSSQAICFKHNPSSEPQAGSTCAECRFIDNKSRVTSLTDRA